MEEEKHIHHHLFNGYYNHAKELTLPPPPPPPPSSSSSPSPSSSLLLWRAVSCLGEVQPNECLQTLSLISRPNNDKHTNINDNNDLALPAAVLTYLSYSSLPPEIQENQPVEQQKTTVLKQGLTLLEKRCSSLGFFRAALVYWYLNDEESARKYIKRVDPGNHLI